MHLSIVALNNYTGSKATKSLKKDSKSFDICIAAKISLIAHNNNKNTFKLQTIKIISIKDQQVDLKVRQEVVNRGEKI